MFLAFRRDLSFTELVLIAIHSPFACFQVLDLVLATLEISFISGGTGLDHLLGLLPRAIGTLKEAPKEVQSRCGAIYEDNVN